MLDLLNQCESKIDIQTAFSLLFLFFYLGRSRWTARVRSRIVLFPPSPSKSPLILIICNLPYFAFSLARGSEERRKTARDLININRFAS